MWASASASSFPLLHTAPYRLFATIYPLTRVISAFSLSFHSSVAIFFQNSFETLLSGHSTFILNILSQNYPSHIRCYSVPCISGLFFVETFFSGKKMPDSAPVLLLLLFGFFFLRTITRGETVTLLAFFVYVLREVFRHVVLLIGTNHESCSRGERWIENTRRRWGLNIIYEGR